MQLLDLCLPFGLVLTEGGLEVEAVFADEIEKDVEALANMLDRLLDQIILLLEKLVIFWQNSFEVSVRLRLFKDSIRANYASSCFGCLWRRHVCALDRVNIFRV